MSVAALRAADLCLEELEDIQMTLATHAAISNEDMAVYGLIGVTLLCLADKVRAQAQEIFFDSLSLCKKLTEIFPSRRSGRD